MKLSAVVDKLLPGPGSRVDRISREAQRSIAHAGRSRVAAPVLGLLRGNGWLGHPLHPVVVAVPLGAWTVAAWYDLRGALGESSRAPVAADAALAAGVVAAVPAALTGVAQFLDTRGAARRETAVHAALNNAGLVLFLTSIAARRLGRRSLGVSLSTAGLVVVTVSGYLGGDLSYRHGVGVQEGVTPAGDTPLETS